MSRNPLPRSTPLALALTITSALALALIAGCSGDLAEILGVHASRSAVVPDFGNNRVLIYEQPLSSGQPATTVLGQPDFATTSSGGTASKLNGPNGVSADGPGNLYVADTNNNRVLRFNTPLASGMAASIALGQPDLTTVTSPGGAGATATTLNAPSDAAVDPAGNVWVSDSANNRVVMYAAPISSGMAATVALGQASLTSSGCGVSATALCNPVGIASDAAGNLWVADADNNRVVRFPASSATGAAATITLGQPDLNSNASNNGGLSASSLSSPNAVIVDNLGNVWVADAGNNRVLGFQPPITTAMAATVVLGQPDFVSNTGSATAATLSSPSGLQVTDVNHLLVGDTGNNRSLVFAGPFANGMSATTVLGKPISPAMAQTRAAQRPPPLKVSRGARGRR